MKTKFCSKCGPKSGSKPITEFNWKNESKGLRQSYCRACSARNSQHYYLKNKKKHVAVVMARKERVSEENKSRIIDYLSEHPCVDCQEDNIIVLDFDHEEPSLKNACVSRMVDQGYAWSTISEEISKCKVRCANCHRIRTAKQFGSRKLIWWEQRDSNSHRPV